MRPQAAHKPSLRLRLDADAYEGRDIHVRVPKRRGPMVLGIVIVLAMLLGGVAFWLEQHGGVAHFVQQVAHLDEPAAASPVPATPVAEAPGLRNAEGVLQTQPSAAAPASPASPAAAAPPIQPTQPAAPPEATPAQPTAANPNIASGEVEAPEAAQPPAAEKPAEKPAEAAPAKRPAAAKPAAKPARKPAPRRDPVLKIEQLGGDINAPPPAPPGADYPADPPAPE